MTDSLARRDIRLALRFVAIVLAATVVSVGLSGCALFSKAPERRELLILATFHIIAPEDNPQDMRTAQVAVLVRFVDANKAFVDGIPVKWQLLIPPEQKSRIPDRSPVAWDGAGTIGWAERVQRTKAPAQWGILDQRQAMDVLTSMRRTRSGSIIIAPRVTAFQDTMMTIDTWPHLGFVRSHDSVGLPHYPIAGRAMMHIKNPHGLRVFLDVALCDGLDGDYWAGFLDSILSPQAPPNPDFLPQDGASSWRMDVERVYIVTDVPDASTLVIRCSGYEGQGMKK